MASRMEGRVALVTGGSSGIGRTTALALAGEGARVVVAARRVAEGTETVELVQAEGGEATFVRTDVTSDEQVKALVATTVEVYGRLDCAFNNAAVVGEKELIHEYPEDSWNEVIRTNLTGVWLCLKYEIGQMLEQGDGGAIVNIASLAGLRSAGGLSAYVAAKHGVVGLTKTAAREYGAHDIRVNVLCPGWVQTPMLDRRLEQEPDLLDRVSGMAALGRVADAKEIADAVVWLCSEASSYVTGNSLIIDGGVMA